jgi:hypothetical protein
MSDDNQDAARAFGDPDGPDGRLRIPRGLVVLVAGALTVAVVALVVLALVGGSGEPAAEPAPTAAEAPDCIALWNDEDSARHQIAAAFRRIGDARVHVDQAGGRCRVTIASKLAGQGLRFTQDDSGVFGAFGPPEVLGDPPDGDADARLRNDGTLR